jgi:phosphoglycerate dehydrogenase-like enzyme/sugar (pentulose or hexulose) kinase
VTRRCLMGLDLGGGGARCLLLDLAGGEPIVASRSWADLFVPGLDLDLEAVLARLAASARAALAKAGDAARVVGLAVTAVRFGSVVIDRSGRVLLAASNRDSRAALEALGLASEAGAELQRRTGHWPLAIGSAARVRALAKQGGLAQAHALLALDDWVAWRLTGELATDRSQAGVSGLWNVADGAWDEAALARSGASTALLPPVREAGARLGALRPEAAAALGLEAGIPVAVGGGDTQCALLGMGVLAPGGAGAVCGTTLPIQQVVTEPRADEAGRLWLEPHLGAGRFVLESNAGTCGEALDWLGRLLFAGARSGAARLMAEASEAAPGAGGLLSSFGTQLFDARAMAFPVGDLALSHLIGTPDESRPRLARAAAEGVAYGLRANLEQLRECAGRGALPLRIGAGMARSRAWAQLVADVLGEPVDVAPCAESSALGAALCAGVGAGVWRSLAEAAETLAAPIRIEPRAGAAARYAELYPQWREWHETRRAGDPLAQGHALRALAQPGTARGGASAAPRPRMLVAADLDPEALALLESLGEVSYASYRQVGRLLVGEKLVEALRGYQVFVTEIDLVDAKSLLELPELRVVAACRGDAVNVDAEACAKLGIPVLHAPGRNADAVADLTVAFLLALARKLPEAIGFLRDPGLVAGDLGAMARAYASLRGRELWRKTVGLVGLGAVGRKVAERLLPFGVELLAFDPGLPTERVIAAGAEPVSLGELLERSDFVSLHAAVTDASRGLLGAAELARMKKGACLVNTARAALVDEEALAKALVSGHLAGAGLDVFGVEPPGADHPLLAAPGVIATPHVGGNTAEIGAHQGRIVGEDLARLLRGEGPRHVVRREALAGFSWDAPRGAPDAETRAWLLARPAPSLTDLQRDKKH